VLDFRETAPAGIDAAAFEKRPFDREAWGKWAGVPGEVAGLYELYRRQGKLPWARLVEPAMRAARDGFEVEKHLASMGAWVRSRLSADDALARFLSPQKGFRLEAGARLQNAALGRSLDWIAKLGPRGFYTGPIAVDIVNTARRAGGALSLDDLARYRVVARSPLHTTWEGYDVYTMPPPSAGGLMLMETLGLFTKEELSKLDPDSGLYQHRVNEAFRGAVADRMRYLGDPSYQAIDLGALLAPERLSERKRHLADDAVRPLPEFEQLEHGTHHLVTADAAGNLVSLTTTVNRAFGTKLMTESGFVLNDELDDFSSQADVQAYGLSKSPNRPRSGARPVSSMTPTLVLRDGSPVLAIGGSGGTRIATAVTQSVLSHLVFGMPAEAIVKHPRFSTPMSGGTIEIDAGLPQVLANDLKRRGHQVAERSSDGSTVQLITIDGSGKRAAADPRRFGLALWD
jgi:gamma-glutamyltranspeptidase/glutathione hydrolase